MKRAKNLFEVLISDENLSKAIDAVNKTHHWKTGHQPNTCTAWVEETKEERIRELRNKITRGYVPKKPIVSTRWEPSALKMRTINQPIQWPDQYIHHALIQVLQPVMMRGMDRHCSGSIKGRGIHYAAYYIEKWMNTDVRGTKYCLACDIYHFYESLKPEIIIDRMNHLIKDERTIDLIERVVRDGIKIGFYTSQWFANTVLQPLDVIIREDIACTHYVRYMDNFTIFSSNKRKLHRLKNKIEKWLNDHGLAMKGDWQVYRVIGKEEKKPLKEPRRGFTRPKGRMVDAVGYRFGRGFVLPRKRTFFRMKRKVRRYRYNKWKKKPLTRKMAAGLLSRFGMLKHCTNHNLYQYLYQGKKLPKELKRIVRKSQKEEKPITWNTYMEQRRKKKSLEPKAAPTPT